MINTCNEKIIKVRVGSVVKFKEQSWIVSDFCTPCKLVWIERLGKKKKEKNTPK